MFSVVLVLTYMMLVLKNVPRTPEKKLDLHRSKAFLCEVPPDNQLGDEELYPPSPTISVTWVHQEVEKRACQVRRMS